MNDFDEGIAINYPLFTILQNRPYVNPTAIPTFPLFTLHSSLFTLHSSLFTLHSSIVFFCIVSILFGPDHFAEPFAGQLWFFMSIYALILIVLVQVLWYSALGRLDSRVVGKWTSCTPIFGVIFAFFLNGERPSTIQVASFAVIMIGIWLTTLGKQMPPKPEENKMAVEAIAAQGESSATAT